ncbi:MAG TPA: hypothetical protein VK951_08120, partial [Miltoncostaeaceae bacterium]|nr:hypothetical protein [Miltoncostaeaceae bacterium]
PMIDVNCPHCGRVLVGSRQIVALTSGEGGIEVAYVCWCGRPGAERVGRAAPRPRRRPTCRGPGGSRAGPRP